MITNADKYLKDGVDEEEFVNELHYFWWANKYDVCDGIRKFLNAEAKKKTPTLTEDERVILRNLSKDYIFIGKKDKFLYIKADKENEDYFAGNVRGLDIIFPIKRIEHKLDKVPKEISKKKIRKLINEIKKTGKETNNKVFAECIIDKLKELLGE